MSNFKPGDIVWCLLYGKGIVVSVSPDGREYPVRVDFPSIDVTNVEYTSDGEFYSVGNRVLFFSEPIVKASTISPFKSKLIGKHVVLVKANGTSRLGVVVSENYEHITISTLESKGLTLYVKAALTAIYEFSDTNYI